MIPSALVRSSLGIVSHLSVEPSHTRIGELHLVLFPNRERACLFALLVGRPSPGLDLLDLALAKFQFDLTLS